MIFLPAGAVLILPHYSVPQQHIPPRSDRIPLRVPSAKAGQTVQSLERVYSGVQLGCGTDIWALLVKPALQLHWKRDEKRPAAPAVLEQFL